MRTLSLLRHAKSDWSSPGMQDFERPLAPRGQDAAPRMGAYMAREGVTPQRILCSSSVRTRQTLGLVLPFLAGHPEVVYIDALYLAPASRMLAHLFHVPDEVGHVMMVGHDPGMHELAVALAGDGDPAALGQLRMKFPTGALAVLSFEAERWRAVAPGSGRLLRFMVPRSLS